MPPKSKRQRHVAYSLELAREAKRTRVESEEGCGARTVEVTDKLEDLVESADALDSDDEEKDPTFELESSMVSDNDFMAETFCEDWVSHLGKEDCVSLGVFLCFQLAKHLALGETKAAELAGVMIGKSDKTIRKWRKEFFENNGMITETQQGRYERSGIVSSNEELNKKATVFIHENTNVKGKPNLTIGRSNILPVGQR